jgi:hypothetical protein
MHALGVEGDKHLDCIFFVESAAFMPGVLANSIPVIYKMLAEIGKKEFHT